MSLLTHVRLLGEVGALIADTEVDLGSARQRTLFAVLVMRANQVVSRIELIRAVWGSDAPATVESSVYTYIGRLRRVLEPARSPRAPSAVIDQNGSGYRLRIPPHRVDVRTFEAHVEAAKRYRDGGDAAGALCELDSGLGLWTGEAFAGLSGPFVDAERSRLEELRITAMEERVSALIDLGRADEAIGELITLKRLHPLREGVRALLMAAFHACGRRAEALNEFLDIRARLVGELGIEPGLELRRTHEAILRDPVGRRTAGPPAGGTAGGARAVPAQLPMEVSGFVGRRTEADRLHRLAEAGADDGGAVVVVDGPPGVGKSALAVRFAHRIAHRFPDGQLYVDMSGFGGERGPLTADEARRILLSGLGADTGGADTAPGAGPDERFAAYRSALAGRRLLLLLDNVRSVDQVRPLLPGGSSAKVLVTSRNRLSGLAIRDGAALVTLDPLPPADSAALLRRSIRSGGGGEVPDDVLTEVAELCGHLPAALRAAAVRIASAGARTVRDLLTEGNPLDFLDAEADAAVSLRAALSSSLRALSPQAAQAFVALGRSDGESFDTSTAVRLTGVGRTEALGRLNQLVRAHLLERDAHGGFAMNRLVHAYARELVGAAPRSSVNRGWWPPSESCPN